MATDNYWQNTCVADEEIPHVFEICFCENKENPDESYFFSWCKYCGYSTELRVKYLEDLFKYSPN